MTHLTPKINLFFMKTIFIASYKSIEECYTVISPKCSELKSHIFSTEFLQNWYIFLYTLINQLYKYHKDQTSCFAIPTV